MKIFLKFLFTKLLSLSVFPRKKNRVAIIRIDHIGDYVLFRNFLKILRGSPKYHGKEIILIGNEIWRDLAEHFDKDSVHSFFWVDRNKFYSSKLYKFKTIYRLKKLRLFQIINPIHSLDVFTTDLVLFSGAQERISCETDDVNNRFYAKIPNLFTKVVPSLPNSSFEFFRNKAFFENLIEQSIDLESTSFDIKKAIVKKARVVIFPGASAVIRCWSPLNFSILINTLGKEYPNFEFYILGSKNDWNIGEKIIENADKGLIIKNLCGFTTLVELVHFLNESALLISNETSAVHFAAALKVPAICISNGNHFLRFNPYPESICENIWTVYPDELFYEIENYELLHLKCQYKSEYDINNISPSVVFELTKNLIRRIQHD